MLGSITSRLRSLTQKIDEALTECGYLLTIVQSKAESSSSCWIELKPVRNKAGAVYYYYYLRFRRENGSIGNVYLGKVVGTDIRKSLQDRRLARILLPKIQRTLQHLSQALEELEGAVELVSETEGVRGQETALCSLTRG